MKNTSRYQKGFTLIEVMVVLGLMGFLFGALFSSYIQIQQLIRDQSLSAQTSFQALTAIRAISDDMNNLYYLDWDSKSFFKGIKNTNIGSATVSRCDMLNFVSGTLYSNSSVLQSRTYSITYFANANENGEIILYRQEDAFADYTKPSYGIPVPILKNILKFEVQYSTNRETWKDEWNAKLSKSLPRYIRFTLSWQEGSVTREFTFITTPPVVFFR